MEEYKDVFKQGAKYIGYISGLIFLQNPVGSVVGLGAKLGQDLEMAKTPSDNADLFRIGAMVFTGFEALASAHGLVTDFSLSRAWHMMGDVGTIGLLLSDYIRYKA